MWGGGVRGGWVVVGKGRECEGGWMVRECEWVCRVLGGEERGG